MPKLLIIIGCVLVFAGLAMSHAPWLINWFGKLPGDVHIQNENSSFYFPITSMVIISVIISIGVRLFKLF